jgi:hypothetical protein
MPGAHLPSGPVQRGTRAEKKLEVATLGGSITAGIGGYDDNPAWTIRLNKFLLSTFGLDTAFGANITFFNGAMSGTTSGYMSACYNAHIDPSADLVFMEYAVNDNDDADMVSG